MEKSASIHKFNKRKQEAITGFIMIAPAVILLTIFVFIPLIMAIYRSFFDTNGFGTTFVGLDYYIKTIKNSDFMSSILYVLCYAVIITVVQMIISFLFANVLVRIKGRYGIFVRTIIYLPYLLSGVIVSIIFYLLTAYNGGVINHIIGLFNGEPIAFDSTVFWGSLSIIIPTIWIGFGYTTLVMYAGLINIPRDYFEAAEVDGAGFWQRTFFITLPCMKNYFILLIVTSIVANLQMYEIPLMMLGNGLASRKISTPVLYIMNQKAKGANISDSEITAMALILMVIILIINSIVFYMFRDRKEDK